MFDVTLLLLIDKVFSPQLQHTWLILFNLTALFLLTRSRPLGCSLIILQKILIIFPVAFEHLDTNFIIKNLFWMGFFSMYLFQLCIELSEAYFNPKFTASDMSLSNYHVSGYLEGLDNSFVVTNLTRNGFFGFNSSTVLKRTQNLKGCINVLGDEYPFSGKIVNQSPYGFGVKVVITSNWDKLYRKIKNLKFLELYD